MPCLKCKTSNISTWVYTLCMSDVLDEKVKDELQQVRGGKLELCLTKIASSQRRKRY